MDVVVRYLLIKPQLHVENYKNRATLDITYLVADLAVGRAWLAIVIQWKARNLTPPETYHARGNE